MPGVYRLFVRADGWHVGRVDAIAEEIVFPDRATALAWLQRQEPQAVEDPEPDAQPAQAISPGAAELPRGGDHVIRSSD